MFNRTYDYSFSELDNRATDGHKRVVFLIDVGNAVFLAIAVFTADYDGKNGRRFGKASLKSLAGFNLLVDSLCSTRTVLRGGTAYVVLSHLLNVS